MKAEEVRKKSIDELREDIKHLRREKLNLRFQRVGGELKNTARIRDVRRDIARIKCEFRVRETASSAQ